MAKIFISYRRVDLAEAELLATEIRNAGHTVWIDEWEVSLGDSLIERINDGLGASSYLLLCYSSSGVDSPWIGREWMSSLARQLNGASLKILPVILTGGSPPPIMADLKYVDLTKNWTSGVAEVLKAIR